MKDFKVTVEKIDVESFDTKTFHFRLSNNEEIDFKAGQYIFIKHLKEGKPMVKPYSIASSPSDKNKIEIVLNKIPNGYFSTYLCDRVNVGDVLEIKGPLGLFNLKEPINNDVIFVGTGTGIGPLRSMIRRVFELRTSKKIWLFFGEKTEEEILYKEEFEELEKEHENFRYIPILSRQEWNGEKGHVQDAIKKYIKNSENMEAYICGLINMVDETKSLLKDLGFDPKKIYVEKYN